MTITRGRPGTPHTRSPGKRVHPGLQGWTRHSWRAWRTVTSRRTARRARRTRRHSPHSPDHRWGHWQELPPTSTGSPITSGKRTCRTVGGRVRSSPILVCRRRAPARPFGRTEQRFGVRPGASSAQSSYVCRDKLAFEGPPGDRPAGMTRSVRGLVRLWPRRLAVGVHTPGSTWPVVSRPASRW